MIRLIKHTVKALLYGMTGGLAVLIVIFVLFLESRPVQPVNARMILK